jgi:hypothetical protein
LGPLASEAVTRDAALSERYRMLAAMPDVIKAKTSFGCWPAAAPPSPPAN